MTASTADTGRLPSITTRHGRSFLIAGTTTPTPNATAAASSTNAPARALCCAAGGSVIPSAARTALEVRRDRSCQGRARSATRADISGISDPDSGSRAGEVWRGDPGGGSERRTLPGVCTYLIDTPKDSGLPLRQRFLSFQEENRGLGKSKNDVLPEIPFRLNPRPELPSPLPTMNRSPSILKVDVATSPMLVDGTDGDSNLSPSRTDSPASSTARTVTFATEPPEVTSVKTKRAENIKTKTLHNGVKRSNSKETEARSLNKSVSFTSEKSGKTNRSKKVRECTKVKLYSFDGENLGKECRSSSSSSSSHVTGHFPDFPDSARTPRKLTDSSEQMSSSLSDLTDFGLLFSLLGQANDTASTPRSSDSRTNKLGPNSLFHSKKSKSLLDLKSIQDCADQTDLSAYHKRQRIAHLAFRRDNSVRQPHTLSIEEADKEWMDMVNTPVVDKTEYDKFASRRKPVTPNRKSGKSYTPKSGTNFKLTQPASGKVFPVFFSDGLPVRKFGRAATYRRKISKSKT